MALLSRNPANYESIVKEINAAGGKAIGVSTDVSSASSVKGAFAEIQKEFKGKQLAAAVYNVGGKFVRKPFLELTLEDYEAGYEANGYVKVLVLDRENAGAPPWKVSVRSYPEPRSHW